MHPSLIDGSIAARVDQDGLWGFTGETSAPPSPSAVADSLPALAEWGITLDKLVRSATPSALERSHLQRASSEVDTYVCQRWKEDEWETAWFVNPPVSHLVSGSALSLTPREQRLQSVPGLAHIHVFARKKAPEEVVAWRLNHPAD